MHWRATAGALRERRRCRFTQHGIGRRAALFSHEKDAFDDEILRLLEAPDRRT
jgi:hypothetical protein